MDSQITVMLGCKYRLIDPNIALGSKVVKGGRQANKVST